MNITEHKLGATIVSDAIPYTPIQNLKPQHSYVDYVTHFRDLAACLATMYERPEIAVFFGNPDIDKFHHRIAVIRTPGGSQFAIHRVTTGLVGRQYGSGEYLGYPTDSKIIIGAAQKHLQDYYRDSTNPLIAARQQQYRERDRFHYFLSEAN